MSIPTGDNAFLHALELNVRTELTLAETSQPEEEAVRVPIDEWLSDPADDQRYEASLRSLLGAVEALEDGSGPGGHPPLGEVSESVITAGPVPNGPDRVPRRKAAERCRSRDNTWLAYCG
jgi:hypothetical protein